MINSVFMTIILAQLFLGLAKNLLYLRKKSRHTLAPVRSYKSTSLYVGFLEIVEPRGRDGRLTSGSLSNGDLSILP